METELVRSFLAIARNLNFTRAAEELNTTQPLLSRAMRRLEDIVGEELFDRSRRRISLTAPGQAFLAEAQDILDQVNRALQQARTAGQGTRRTLRIGYMPALQCQGLSKSITLFRRSHPDITLDFRLMTRGEEVAALRAGELDVALIDAGVCDRRDLAWEAIGRNHIVLAVPSEWGYDPDEPLNLEQLRGRPFVLPDPDEVPDMHLMLMMLFTRASVEPNVLKHVHDIWEIRFLVAAGMCAAFVYGTSLTTQFEGIDFIPMPVPMDDLALDFYVIWKPKRISSTVRDFTRCLIENADRSGGDGKSEPMRQS